MSRKKYVSKPTTVVPQQNLKNLDLNQLDTLIKGLSVQKDFLLEKSLNGGDLEEIIKAQAFLEKTKVKSPTVKSNIFIPDDYQQTGKGYKDAYSGVPFEVLARMANIPIVKTIIGTRIDQIKTFLKFSQDDQKPGYKIQRKRGLFDDNKKELSSQDKRKVEYIVNCIEYGGRGGKWDDGDDLGDFVTKIMSDSLSVDQATAEIIRDRKGDYFKHVAVDGSLIRLLDCNDPRYADQFKGMEVNNVLPKYCQVWNGQIATSPLTQEPILYYPWELMYGQRNKTTNVRGNG